MLLIYGHFLFRVFTVSQLRSLEYSGAKCPSGRDLVVSGNSYSSNWSFFVINIQKCVGETYWKTETEIDDEIPNIQVEITIVNTFFDFDDYEQPIQTYLDDRFFYTLLPDLKLIKYAYIRRNEVETQDGFFYFTPNGAESEFVNIQRIDESLAAYSSYDDVVFCKCAVINSLLICPAISIIYSCNLAYVS